MRERPIPFSAPMVRALLVGTKTQTRRAMRYQVVAPGIVQMARPGYCEIVNEYGVHIPGFYCPYGQPGDRLWVREAWHADSDHDDKPPRDIPEGSHVWYEADRGLSAIRGLSRMGKLRPGMFMPRWASRITLEVTGVRVERLQGISRGDAMAEGCPFANMADGPNPRDWYAELWGQITGPGTWAANPWLWVVEFKRVDRSAER